jgi:phage I-like protein
LAAGWIEGLEARTDGLYSRVKWTAKALQHILEGEFRYYSPVIKVTRPMELKHAALTNTPALKGTALSPLLAARFAGGDAGATGEVEILVMTENLPAKPPASQQQEEATAMLKKLIAKFGLQPEATEAEVLALVETREQEAVAFKTQAAALPEIFQALGLKTDAKPGEVTAAITALKAAHQGDQGKLTALTTEVAALKDRESTRDAEAVVEVALKEGKLTPAERDLAVTDAKRDPEGFKARLALRPQIVPIGDKLGVLKDGGHGSDGEPGPEAPVDRRVAFKARKLADEKKIDLAAATEQVLKHNPELAREYKQSFLG